MGEKINLYTKEHCVQCQATQRQFNRLNEGQLDIELHSLQEEPDALDRFVSAGFRQAPIVEVEDSGEIWSGYRPELIQKVAMAALHNTISM